MKEKSNPTDVLKFIWNKYNYILIFVLIFLIYLIINGSATTVISLMNIPRHSTVVGIIALGMGLIILTGDIDLSVGSQLSLIGGLTVMLFNQSNNITACLIFAVLAGAMLGMINGFLVGLIRMPAFIVTLATMLMYRSISQTVMNAHNWTIYQLNAAHTHWKTFFSIGNASVPGTFVPILVLILICVVALMTYITTSTKFGKKVYALGSNEKAALLSGINVRFNRLIVFGIAGMLVGFASFLYVANVGSVDPATTGKNYELYAIAGVVIGGIAMTGGKGSLLGVVFGSMSFTIIDKIINALGVNPLINDTIKGAILLLAIALQMIPVITGNLRKKTSKESIVH